MNSQYQSRSENEIDVKDDQVQEYVEPPLYNIVFLNDDVTPIDFVSKLIQKVFYVNQTVAMALTMRIHNEGRAIVKTCTKDIAETKLHQIRIIVASSSFPLQCLIEQNK